MAKSVLDLLRIDFLVKFNHSPKIEKINKIKERKGSKN